MTSSEINRGGRTRYQTPEGRYSAYDLVTAKPDDGISLITVNPNNRTETETFNLTKLETPRGASALDGWLLGTLMGEATVRLMLLDRSKGGGPTALHGRVVLREGRELAVSARVLGMIDDDMRLGRQDALSTFYNMGAIALMTDHLRLTHPVQAESIGLDWVSK